MEDHTWYVVLKGWRLGPFGKWLECLEQVKDYLKLLYKDFHTEIV